MTKAKTKQDYFNDGRDMARAFAVAGNLKDYTEGYPIRDMEGKPLNVSMNGSWQARAWRAGFDSCRGHNGNTKNMSKFYNEGVDAANLAAKIYSHKPDGDGAGQRWEMPVFGTGASWQAKAFAGGFRAQVAKIKHRPVSYPSPRHAHVAHLKRQLATAGETKRARLAIKIAEFGKRYSIDHSAL